MFSKCFCTMFGKRSNNVIRTLSALMFGEYFAVLALLTFGEHAWNIHAWHIHPWNVL